MATGSGKGWGEGRLLTLCGRGQGREWLGSESKAAEGKEESGEFEDKRKGFGRLLTQPRLFCHTKLFQYPLMYIVYRTGNIELQDLAGDLTSGW